MPPQPTEFESYMFCIDQWVWQIESTIISKKCKQFEWNPREEGTEKIEIVSLTNCLFSINNMPNCVFGLPPSLFD